jgi:hypothetical protein
MVVAVGCSQKPDARMAKLEERVQNMATGLFDLECQFTNLASVVGELTSTNLRSLEGLMELALEQQEHSKRLEDAFEKWQEDQERVNKLQESVNRLQAGSAASGPRPAAPRPVQQPAMKRGVPLAIYNTIAADAVRKWGSDFEMQNYEIGNQIEAYKKLHP